MISPVDVVAAQAILVRVEKGEAHTGNALMVTSRGEGFRALVIAASRRQPP